LGFTKITAPAEDIAGLAKVNIGDRVVVPAVVIDALASLDFRCPEVGDDISESNRYPGAPTHSFFTSYRLIVVPRGGGGH
jgi:hypothetical protein